MTSQVNVVNPGGAGQTVHRDYHLGFQSPKASGRVPGARARRLAGAHPAGRRGALRHAGRVGPDALPAALQKYAHGYLAYWLPEFQEYFVAHHVQLPLAKGDAVFFNPALFHAAGTNHTTDVRRMANLLQISSAFGRAMETVDRGRVVEAVYPALFVAAGSRDAARPRR